MAKIVIRHEGGQTIEISDLTLDEVKELAGLNRQVVPSAPSSPQNKANTSAAAMEPDVDGFMSALSDRAKVFIAILKKYPEGIEANTLAPLLGLNDPRQIGGFTGGGLAKIAKKFKIKMKDIYKSDVTFPNKKRTRMFYAGKLTKRQPLQMEKPAI
jgi:hypothetical protein